MSMAAGRLRRPAVPSQRSGIWGGFVTRRQRLETRPQALEFFIHHPSPPASQTVPHRAHQQISALPGHLLAHARAECRGRAQTKENQKAMRRNRRVALALAAAAARAIRPTPRAAAAAAPPGAARRAPGRGRGEAEPRGGRRPRPPRGHEPPLRPRRDGPVEDVAARGRRRARRRAQPALLPAHRRRVLFGEVVRRRAALHRVVEHGADLLTGRPDRRREGVDARAPARARRGRPLPAAPERARRRAPVGARPRGGPRRRRRGATARSWGGATSS